MTDLHLRKCALCLESIGNKDDIVMTRDFFAQTDPLSEYANVVMHKRCFMSWSKRDGFSLPPDDVVRYHMRTLDGLEIIRFERKRNQVITSLSPKGPLL